MSYKTILVHCDASKSVSHRLGVAVDLAQRFGARLVGLHVRRPFETPVFADGSFPMDDFFKAHEEGVKADEAEASAAFAKAIKGKELATEWRTGRRLCRWRAARAGPLCRPRRRWTGRARTHGDAVGPAGDRGARDRASGPGGAAHRRQAAGEDRPAVLECQPRGCTRRGRRPAVSQGGGEGHRPGRQSQGFGRKATAPNRAPMRPPGSPATASRSRSSAMWRRMPMSAR